MAEGRVLRDGGLPKRSFMNVVARLFDFSGSLDYETIERIRKRYREPLVMPSAEESIRATWESVGDSMRWAIGEFEKDSNETAPK